MDINKYQKHIESLTKYFGIRILQKPKLSGMMWVEGTKDDPTPYIECPTIENQTDYLINLHEIGHCVRGHTQGRPPYTDKKFYFTNGVLKSEAEAWEYALDNSIDGWSEESRRFAWDTCLGSYYLDYLYTRGAYTRLGNGNRHHVSFVYDHPGTFFEKIMNRIRGNLSSFTVQYVGRWDRKPVQ